MTKLESEILAWIAEHNDDPQLRSQLAATTVSRRDFVGTGYFIYLETDTSTGGIDESVRIRCPFIETPLLPDGAGCSLFVRAGTLHYLEIYSRSGFFPQELDSYRLLDDPG